MFFATFCLKCGFVCGKKLGFQLSMCSDSLGSLCYFFQVTRFYCGSNQTGVSPFTLELSFLWNLISTKIGSVSTVQELDSSEYYKPNAVNNYQYYLIGNNNRVIVCHFYDSIDDTTV